MKKTTNSMSPQEAKKRADALNEQAKRLREYSQNVEMGEVNINANPKNVSMSKNIINISYIVFGLTGVIGSFLENFNMTKYTAFLETFALIWAPLVISVGGGRAFKNYVTKKYGEQQ